MRYVLTVDFGSTFTKVTAVDPSGHKLLGCAKAFTTIETDIRDGLGCALKELSAQCGSISFDEKLASSSAAGGLKMISCGLVPELTSKASKMAASSAGAKVVKTYSYELSKTEQDEIYAANPDLILLCGGIDGGNKSVILHNARKLAEIDRCFSVIVAGNKTAGDEAADILKRSGKQAILCENVMPEFNMLNIMPAKNAIRDLFIKNIIEAKGLSEAQRMMTSTIVPTPLAVFEAVELLSRGAATGESGLGDLMAFDVGGATTDVYSMASGEPTRSNVVLKGLREPFSKRTVEGDIGVRYSISSLIHEAGADIIAANAGLEPGDVRDWESRCKEDPSCVPEPGSAGKRLDDELAAMAVEISSGRHCGFYESVYTPFGETFLQTGKDLSGVGYIIGTGGSVINSAEPGRILKRALYDIKTPSVLKPGKAKLILDEKNILASMGLLGRLRQADALKILTKELKEI